MGIDNFVPFECPVCLTLMQDFKDVFTYFSCGCCKECKSEYLMPNKFKSVVDAKISKETRKSLSKKRKSLPSYILR